MLILGKREEERDHAVGMAYSSCLATYQLPLVEFYVALHVRQSRTRLTDSQFAQNGPIEVLETMGRMGRMGP